MSSHRRESTASKSIPVVTRSEQDRQGLAESSKHSGIDGGKKHQGRTSTSATAKSDLGTLPYASEPFGVYQPLIGWKSTLSGERLGNALANRAIAQANARYQPAPRPPAFTAPGPLAPRFLNRTGTRVGDAIVKHLHGMANPKDADGEAGNQTTQKVSEQDVVELLKKKKHSKLVDITKSLVSHLNAENTDPIMSNDLRRELSMATVLHELAQTHPQAVVQMFQSGLDRVARIGASIDLMSADTPSTRAFLSPIGLLHLFREYFFQIGTFLGEPVGHIWLSPGGTVEMVESSTRRQLTEQTTEQSTETTSKSEVDTTDKDELSDAVKEDNASDTKLGASVSGGGGVGVWHASASASFSVDNSRKQAHEQTHKKMREQSTKLSNEIKQNFKTTFRTVTETTDTTSRRYVLQNTTQKLVSYELSRKMRKVAVQVQDLGSRLCFELYVDNPGDPLGVGEFVYATASALDSSIKPPDQRPIPPNIEKPLSTSFPFHQTNGGDDDTDDTYSINPDNPDTGIFSPDVGADNIIDFVHTVQCPPTPAGFVLSSISAIDFHGASVNWDPNVQLDAVKETFTIHLTSAYFNKQRQIPFDVTLVYSPTDDLKAQINAGNTAANAKYSDQIAAENEVKFFDTVRSRLKLVSQVQPRAEFDLREEERDLIYRALISRLYGSDKGWRDEDYHVASEIIRYFFDIDSMLYFVAPDWWKPRTQKVQPILQGEQQPVGIIAQSTLVDRINVQGTHSALNPPGQRPNYLMTEETSPAPLGASLGWMMQIDGDSHRNAFLNSPWVKAVLPILPGREREAIAYMKRTEVAGIDGLSEPYPYFSGTPPDFKDKDPDAYKNKKMEDVLLIMADAIAEEYRKAQVPQPTGVGEMAALPEEMVFSHGYDPLEGGTKFDTKAYQPFSEWIEILPTDQVVAVEYHPDKHGSASPGG